MEAPRLRVARFTGRLRPTSQMRTAQQAALGPTGLSRRRYPIIPMSREPPGRYFVGLNWESYKARLMTVLTTGRLGNGTGCGQDLTVYGGLRELRMRWAKWKKVQ